MEKDDLFGSSVLFGYCVDRGDEPIEHFEVDHLFVLGTCNVYFITVSLDDSKMIVLI